jgi:hypothetical protein
MCHIATDAKKRIDVGLFTKKSAQDAQVPIPDDIVSYDAEPSEYNPTTKAATPLSSDDLTQPSEDVDDDKKEDEDDESQSTDDADDKPWAGQETGPRKAQHSNDKPTSTGQPVIIVAILVIIAMVGAGLWQHYDGGRVIGHRYYRSYNSDRQLREAENDRKTRDIRDEAITAYNAIFAHNTDVSEALSTIQNEAISYDKSSVVTQDQVDALKKETAGLSASVDDFTKTEAYRRYLSVRRAHQTYDEHNKKYIEKVNNFADSAIAYTKAAQNCDQVDEWTSMDMDATAYAKAKQQVITNCKAAAQGITDSHDEAIKQYAEKTITRMNDAQKELDGIKALGSADDIYDDETKYNTFDKLSSKLDKNLNIVQQSKEENPIYKDLLDADPHKDMFEIQTTIYKKIK